MTRTISGAEALQLLEEVVAEKGADYVYPYSTCVYFEDPESEQDMIRELGGVCGQPSCIVGHVLAKIGFGLDSIIGSGNFETNVPDLVIDGLEFDPAAVRVLTAAQARQDRSWNWGNALQGAASQLAREDELVTA